MKKQFLSIAAAFILLAACQSSGSSTIGEKDESYSNSFNEHSGSKKAGEHGSPASHAAPADHSQVNHQADTTKKHATDSANAAH